MSFRRERPGVKVTVERTFSNGTTRTVNPDGSEVTVHTDGSQTIIDADGDQVDLPPGTGFECNSFPAGTQVRLANGTYRNIETIAAGDQVLSYNTAAQQWTIGTVTAQWSATDHGSLATATLVDGSAITATDHRRFWIDSDQSWVELDEITPGNLLLTPAGPIEVAQSRLHNSTSPNPLNRPCGNSASPTHTTPARVSITLKILAGADTDRTQV